MFYVPYSTIFSWPKPNYENSETFGPALWIATAFFLPASAACVLFRLYCRIFVRRWFGLDDVFILLAWIFSIAVTICVAIGDRDGGWNRHTWDIPITLWQMNYKVLYATRIFWGLASALVRLSVLCLYYRLARAIQAPKRALYILHGVTTFNSGLFIFYFVYGIVPCFPINHFWTFPYKLEGCANDIAVAETVALLNTFSEFVLATLPLYAVFRLGVDRKQRWDVICLLCLGYIVVLAGCFRTYYVYKALTGVMDITWWGNPQWICSEVELDLALMCACAAPLRPAVGRVYMRLRGIPVNLPKKPRTRSLLTKKSGRMVSDSEMQFSRSCDTPTPKPSFEFRAIDLEGIATDGYGYSVTITGPVKLRKPLMERLGLKRETPEKHEDKMLEACKPGMEISHKTEVMVRSSWQSAALASPRRPSEIDSIEMCCSPDVPKTAGLHMPVTKTKLEDVPNDSRSFYEDEIRSVESLEALPTIPPTARSPTPDRLPRRRSSLFKLPPLLRRQEE